MNVSPIHIQELVELIAVHLDHVDLASCARVNRIWHHAFSPLLYQHIIHGDAPHKKVVLWSGVQRYSHHTRQLTIAADTFPELRLLGPDCRRLTTLDLGSTTPVNQPRLWVNWLLALVECNPDVHTLRFHLHDSLDHALFRENNVLKRMPGLKNLSIMNDRYPVASSTKSNGVFEAILGCGSQLESLEYEVLWGGSILEVGCVGSSIGYQDDMPWSNLESLVIHDKDGRRESELLKHCPNLRSYKTKVDFRRNGFETLHQLARTATAETPLALEHLDISLMQGPWTAAALDDLLRAPAGPSGLKSISVIHSGVSELTMNTLLTFHAATLEKLVMNNVPWSTPNDLKILLTSCPRLKHLETAIWSDIPWLHELVEPKWNAPELEVLHLKTRQRGRTPSGTMIAWDPKEANCTNSSSPQRLFWNRIGSLQNIKTLHINSESRHRTHPRIIAVVREDIAHLCALKHLEEFQIPPWEEFMSPEVKEELQSKRPELHIDFIDEKHLLS
ncbi:hypothetical protein B0O80DRAFT_430015 [Mortierella sp. GBAus27b]|nr:hypothetical protein BGX31_007630 [Mortierella sp. GBA43]KAI8347829.1 hypothetical protein B0O80DRAFT_430015 [Mortierella sp. GBAus27b]